MDDAINIQKMCFSIVNLSPSHLKRDQKAVNSDIENELFHIFRKYENKYIVMEEGRCMTRCTAGSQ